MYWLIMRGLLGVIFAGLVVWLGLRTAAPHPQPLIVALFGVVAALLGPTAISLIAGSFPSRRSRALDQLAKAGEIEQRVAEATTMQQKVKALESERRRLTTIIRLEARRQVILTRQEILHSEIEQLVGQADQVIAELKAIDAESKLLGQELDNSSVKSEVIAIRDRLQRERTGTGRRHLEWIDGLVGGMLLPMPFAGPLGRRGAEFGLDKIEDLRTKRLARRAARASVEEGPEPNQDTPEGTGEEIPVTE